MTRLTSPKIRFFAAIVACCAYSTFATAQIPNPYSDAQTRALEILNKNLQNVGPEYRGAHPYFNDDVIGPFLDLVERGAWDKAGSLQPKVCEKWRKTRPDQPFTGNFSPGGVELSLDKWCGIKP